MAWLAAHGAPVAIAVDDEPAEVLAQLAGDDINAVLVRLGRSLRTFHDTDASGCPWDRGLALLVAQAQARVAAGSVDPARFDPPYRRYGADALAELVVRSVPAEPRVPVVTHGTARLSSVRLESGEIRWSAVEACGLGDPYRDLATMAADLASAIAPEALGPFLDAYGLNHPDVIRLDWHLLIDQLLR